MTGWNISLWLKIQETGKHTQKEQKGNLTQKLVLEIKTKPDTDLICHQCNFNTAMTAYVVIICLLGENTKDPT